MGKGPKTRMKTISSSVDISTSSLRDDMNHGVEDEVDSNTIAPTHSNSLSTLALNDINYQITGLSSTKITSYILTNTIQPLISNIWNFYSQHFLHTDSRNVDNCQQLVNLLKELNSNILLISWNNENTIKTLKSLPNLLLDLVKIAMLYFSNPDFLSSLAQIEQMSSISIQLLQEHRLEKHCDLLLQDIPSYISIFSKSLDTLPLSLSNQEDDKHISQQIAPFLVKIFYLIESYSISYPNRKKLFLNGTTILLQPCLSLYASLLPFQQYSWIIKILKSIDIVLSKMFFDDIHHIEELTQIPLSLLITFGNDWIHLNNCESKKRKSESVKETGMKKQKVSNDKQAKQAVQSYHMSFYTALVDWILNSSDESSEKSPPALSRLLQLYFHASKEMTNITERSGTFVQRWRLHIKRVLHIGLGLIYCICGNQQDDNLHLSSLKFRNRIIKTLNHGLSGDDSNNIQSIGAIPDHEILNLYVHKLGEIVEHTLTRSVKLSAAIGELSEKNFETLFLDIKFLRFSVELDCRVVSDSSLQSALRIIGSIFSWNAVKNSNLGNEGMKFFLKFLELYGDLRR